MGWRAAERGDGHHPPPAALAHGGDGRLAHRHRREAVQLEGGPVAVEVGRREGPGRGAAGVRRPGCQPARPGARRPPRRTPPRRPGRRGRRRSRRRPRPGRRPPRRGAPGRARRSRRARPRRRAPARRPGRARPTRRPRPPCVPRSPGPFAHRTGSPRRARRQRAVSGRWCAAPGVGCRGGPGVRSMKFTLRRRLIVRLGEALERRRPWHCRRKWLGLLCLIGDPHPAAARTTSTTPPRGAGPARRRSAAPASPSAATSPSGARPATPEDLLDPSPREVSEPAAGPQRRAQDGRRSSTCSAAAWLQFMVHDWMSHGKGDPGDADPDPARRRRRLAAGRRPATRWSSPHRPSSARGRPPGGPPVLRQHRDALVGRVPGLRQHPRAAAPGCATRARRPAAAGPDGRLPPDREHGRRAHRASTATGGSACP